MDTQLLVEIARNDNFEDKELLREIAELFVDKPDAAEFIHMYGTYCEVMDDLVDEEPSVDRIELSGRLRMQLSGCAYWQKHVAHLWLVERLIHNTYFDSVRWEKSDEEWKRRDAKVLSHAAYNMLFSVILLEFGYEKLAEISLRFREHAHLRHLNDTI